MLDTIERLKYAIQKPTGLWQDELTSCVAMLKYEDNNDDHDHDDKGDRDKNDKESSLPLKAAAHHLKIADSQYLLLKAHNMVKTRKKSKAQ